ncbi:MAG TPA: patatin-like phospholipase family protein [Rhizobiaceae bacterium]|nr:patatin-like phospholipase family protein [Rhizobiaceae bacterium]
MAEQDVVETLTPVSTGNGPSVAVAFGGGGARGIAHIHIIEALDELGIRPVAISGASIGAIMGAGMASGMRGADIRNHVVSTFGNRTEVMARLWKLRPTKVSELFSNGFRLGQFDVVKVLNAFLPDGVARRFEDLAIPLHVSATDYYGQHETVLKSGDLYSAIGASAAIPALFRPVRRDGRIYIDGGIINPVPFDNIAGLAEIIAGIDVVGGPEGDHDRMPSAIETMFGATQLVMQSVTAWKVRVNHPEILIRPPVARFRVMDFLKSGEVLAATAGIKEDFKRALDAAFERHAAR